MKDLLTSAIAAARAQADEGADDGAVTRMRIRESLAQRGAGRRKKWTLILAVIGSLFGATAFAMHQGWTPFSSPRVVDTKIEEPAPAQVAAAVPRREVVEERPFVAPPGREVAPAFEEPAALAWSADAGSLGASSPASPASVPRPTARDVVPLAMGRVGTPRAAVTAPRSETAPGPVPATAPTIATSAGAGDSTSRTPPIGERVSPEPRSPVAGSSPGDATSAAPTARVATTVRAADASGGELAAYRVAHNAHFRGTDPKAALAAWDRYLAQFPDGRMALDAKYDRALVLVKLERWKEAREALAPFAATNSTYRRAEAVKILDAITSR